MNSKTEWRPIKRFVGDFERGNLEGWSVQEGAQADSIQIVTTPIRHGRYAAQFTVRPADWVHNGNRAELTWDNNDRPGSEGWYSWSFLIPSDYLDAEENSDLWQIMGQWHDQPDRNQGETWADFPKRNPPLAFVYGLQEGVPSLRLLRATYPKGDERRIIATAPIDKGRWIDVVFHIGWSQQEDGFVEAWLDGQPLTLPGEDDHKVFGVNMWNAAPHYLKIGLYRNHEITTTNSVYFDEVRMGNSLEEVICPRE